VGFVGMLSEDVAFPRSAILPEASAIPVRREHNKLPD